MRPSRILRDCFAVSAFLGCSWLAWTQAKAPVTPSKLNKIADDLYELETAGGGLTSNGGNVAIYITNEGVIIVDDKFEKQLRICLKLNVINLKNISLLNRNNIDICFIFNCTHLSILIRLLCLWTQGQNLPSPSNKLHP